MKNVGGCHEKQSENHWRNRITTPFRAIFDEVARKQTPVMLTRGSRPEAVLVSYQDYLRFQEIQESEVLAHFDQVWDRLSEANAAFSEEEIAADIAADRMD